MATTKKTPSKKTEIKASVPTTMEELLAANGTKLHGFKRGETVTGKVKEVTGRTVYIDLGAKTDAIVSQKEYDLARDYFRALKVGDEVTGLVLMSENESGQVILSLRRAATDSKWKAFEQAMNDDSEMVAKVKEATRGGLLVEVDGVFGFIPSSQFGSDLDTKSPTIVGKILKVKVIEVDRNQNKLVLSEKAVSDAEDISKRKEALSAVKIGSDYPGVVVGMVPFGVFVEIETKEAEGKLEGLVHISEISWEKIEDVAKILKEGSKVKVQVIGIDEENGKLALSIKRLSSDPWSVVAAKYIVDSKHKGVVAKIVPYGVLVKLEKGIEGLIHASKMPANMAFKEGDEVDVFVESVDLDKRRLSLGVVETSTREMIYK